MGKKIVHTFIRILAKADISWLFFASHQYLNGDLAPSFVDYPVRAFCHDFQIPADYERQPILSRDRISFRDHVL